MRSPWLVLALAGCGGGASISTEPAVAITARLCNVNSLGLVVVNVDYEVTIDPGQGFVATVEIVGGSPPNVNSSFFCGGWTTTLSGDRDVGCQRDTLSQPETVTIEHLYNSQPSNMPMPTSVTLLGSALLMPSSGTMIANDGETLACTVDVN